MCLILVICVKYGNFYGKNLHVIPKVLGCCFVTKKFDFLDFGVRVGDKMAEASRHGAMLLLIVIASQSR